MTLRQLYNTVATGLALAVSLAASSGASGKDLSARNICSYDEDGNPVVLGVYRSDHDNFVISSESEGTEGECFSVLYNGRYNELSYCEDTDPGAFNVLSFHLEESCGGISEDNVCNAVTNDICKHYDIREVLSPRDASIDDLTFPNGMEFEVVRQGSSRSSPMGWLLPEYIILKGYAGPRTDVYPRREILRDVKLKLSLSDEKLEELRQSHEEVLRELLENLDSKLSRENLPDRCANMQLVDYSIRTKGDVTKIKFLESENYDVKESSEGSVFVTGVFDYCIRSRDNYFGCDTRGGTLTFRPREEE